MSKTKRLWALWLVLSCIGAVVLIGSMSIGGPARKAMLPGPSTGGHHQLELACGTCHTSPFGGGEVLQTSCVNCHKEGLERSRDTHPARKFDDPRNVDRLKVLAVDKCVTCHSEHRPELTTTGGLTIPKDFCFLCHEDVAKERPSHKDVSFATCGSAGCHKYHDNRATNERFMTRALKQPETKLQAFIRLRGLDNPLPKNATPLTIARIDAPAEKQNHAAINAEWLASKHASAGVNCSGCHQPTSGEGAARSTWIEKPDHKTCSTCHSSEVKGFLGGKHGMRLAEGQKETEAALFGFIEEKKLSAMKPELARLPMSPRMHGTELGCSTCHGAHDAKTVPAQVETCLSCHTDQHSLAYKQSAHFTLWEKEQSGALKKGGGVSCATCHMPRENVQQPDGKMKIVAAHNQNMNLRPSEKMARNVCLDCHGLEFSLNALADQNLVARNFKGKPEHRNIGFDWVRQLNAKP